MQQITPQNCPWPNLLCIECNETNCKDETVEAKIYTAPTRPEAVSQSGFKNLPSKRKVPSKTLQRKIDRIKSDKTMTLSVRRSLLAELGVV